MTAWQWIKTAPRLIVLAGAVAVTWGMWLSHVYGVNTERGRWERYRMQVTEVQLRLERYGNTTCLPPMRPRVGRDDWPL
jgi:hypothetical protein